MTAGGQVDEALSRLRAAQDALNACTAIDDRPSVRSARREHLPLAGMPIAVKDLIDQEGLPTTCGSGFLREPAARTAAAVDRLEQAGAVVVARTGLHEFAYGFSSENPWFGPVRNPWDPDTSPGGSSGGSAVAVAAGLVPAAIGTDTGGSVRVPAAMTGIFGLKVTHGRIPMAGVFPLAPSLDTVGPLAREVSILDRVYRAMAGVKAVVDPRSPPGPPSGNARRLPAGPAQGLPDGLRIGVPSQWNDFPATEPEVAAAVNAAVAELARMGADVVPVDDARLAPWGMIQELAGAEAAHVHRQFRRQGKPYGADVAARLDGAEQVTPAAYADAHRWRAGLVEAFAEAFTRVDLLVTPGVAARRKRIGEERLGGQHYRPVLSWFSALVNHAGLPALVVPLAFDPAPRPDLPPPSLQLIAPWWQEDLLLAVAAHLEATGVAAFRRPPLYYGDAA